jgi:hypothetical protein
MDFRKNFELMNNGITKFKKTDYFPEFATPEDQKAEKPAAAKWKEQWGEMRFVATDWANQAYGKLKTYPPPLVLIGFAVAIIVLAEVLSACFGLCCCRGEKVHED